MSTPDSDIIVAIFADDYDQPYAGRRQLSSWDRPDGKTYHDVPLVWLREVTEEDYLRQQPQTRGTNDGYRFWAVSVD